MNWESSALWGIIGAVVSFLVTYYFTKHPISKYKIIYKKETSRLLSNTEMKSIGISVQHDTCNIDNLFFSKVTILNKGYYKITENDFVATHNIKLFTDGQIFPYNLPTIFKDNPNSTSDVKLNFKENKIIDIDIILLHPHESFNFSFFHTDKINYSGDLKDGKIYEYQDRHFKYPTILFLLLINFIVPFMWEYAPKTVLNDISVFIFLYDLILLIVFSSFYNNPSEQ